ncbi:alpha-crystallin A chain-like [Gigantopelta aegis]|uniref:alpha-crystallin A chain-like n=1 Tax=Gigantopelta aegis TaxID=1735272 RepID=UPI001B88C676|nr:alpha-crystallin A chain-like [Gigantopelta aegis]
MFHTMLMDPQCMPPNQTGTDEETTNDEFCVQLDLQHFGPDDIHVKTVDNRLVIHAKHEEKEDEHGYICREFTRLYDLPKDVDPQDVTSTLSRNGVLTIKARRRESITIICTHETTAVPSKDKHTRETTAAPSKDKHTRETTAAPSKDKHTRETNAAPSKDKDTHETTSEPSNDEDTD